MLRPEDAKGKDLEQHLDGESHVEENIQVEEHELLRRSGAIAGVVECEANRRGGDEQQHDQLELAPKHEPEHGEAEREVGTEAQHGLGACSRVNVGVAL